MPKVRFSPRAIADLAEAHRHIASDNPSAADAMIGRVVDRALALGDYPERGAPREHLGRGCRRLIEEPYHLFYEPAGEDLVILRILHGARRITRRLLREG